MNILLDIGLLLIAGYTTGWLVSKIGIPKIVGYILVGIAFGPSAFNIIEVTTVKLTKPLMEFCLTFIAFQIGGVLKWSKIKKHKKEIVAITLLASILPFILIATGILVFGVLFPSLLPFGFMGNLSLALLLGVLASPTAPAATIAVIHQYKSKGKVTNTILGVVALEDGLGIILFSLTLGILSMINGTQEFAGEGLLHSIYAISIAIILGVFMGFLIHLSGLFKLNKDDHWIIIISSLLILCLGISKLIEVDVLMAGMTMGIFVVNKSGYQQKIFKITELYMEEFVFLLFFLLSSLHLDISAIPKAASLISLFVVLRIVGKYLGANWGARIAKADASIRKHTAGGLLPQAGIVIGLVLSIHQHEGFKEISEILLTTIMGATIIHELIGPIAAKHSLTKAGEIE